MDQENIKKRITGGVLALFSRTLVLQAVSFVSLFFLTVLLSPEIFGVFFIVSALISFFGYFSDIGLAAALIQKKEKPTQEELSTVFYIQQGIITALVLLGVILSSAVFKLYGLDQEGRFLYFSFLLGFFLSSLKTIPSVLLERNLEFNKLVLPQIGETLVFNLTAVLLAYFGFNLTSFSWAVILRGVIGLILLYIIKPWRPGLLFNFSKTKSLISFGAPFQMNSILALIKDDLVTLYLGRVLPLSSVGYIGWAKKWAETGLRLIMDSLIKVTFPAFSRLSTRKDILSKALERSFLALALFMFGMTFISIIFMDKLVNFIPKYSKWNPALLSFYLFSLSSVFASFSTVSVNALNALGKIKISLKLMIFWTVSTWILVPVLVNKLGFNGVAIAAFIISLSGVIPVWLIKKEVPFKSAGNLIILGSLSISSGLVLFFFMKTVSGFYFQLGLTGLALAMYFIGAGIIFRKEFLSVYRSVR